MAIAANLRCYFNGDEYFERTKFSPEDLLVTAADLERATSEIHPRAVTMRLIATRAIQDDAKAGEQFERFRRAGAPYLVDSWKKITPYENAYLWCRETGKQKLAATQKKEKKTRPKLGENEPRFIDRGTTIEDAKTGLIWQKDGGAAMQMQFTYYQAVRYAERLNQAGLRNWRLPTPSELLTVYPTEAPFTGTDESGQYWCSGLWNERYNYGSTISWEEKGRPFLAPALNFYRVRCVHDPLPESGLSK